MIRHLKETDIDIVAKIWLDTNIKSHDFISKKYWESNFNMVKNLFLQSEIYVYEDKQTIQAFVGIENDYIEGIFVSNEFQSQGIGKLLLDFIKSKKVNLYLNVYQKNISAVNFYQREGFKIQRENLDKNTGEKEYVMTWKKTSTSNL